MDGLQSCGPCGAAGHPWPEPCMANSVTCLRYAERSRAPGYVISDMVTPCRLFAAHGTGSCLSVRTQPPAVTGAPSQTSTIPYHSVPPSRTSTIPCHTAPVQFRGEPRKKRKKSDDATPDLTRGHRVLMPMNFHLLPPHSVTTEQ